MRNVNSPGYETYEPAEPQPKLKLVEKLNLCACILKDFFRVLVLSLPIFLKLIKEFFIKREKKSVQGWNALITGGAHGIGKEIAKNLCKEGCNIAIADIDGKAAEKTAEELREKYPVKAIAYEVDIADYRILPKLKEDIENDLGPVDILINNAGLMPLLSLREGTEDDIERIVSVNITSQFFTTRTFLNGMIERKRGHIVTLSSMSSLHAIAGAIIYTSTKCAITGFTRALEQEIREEGNSKGIYFTSVHPYFVSTRKDLMSCLNLRMPAITAEETAKATVSGILRNYKVVIMPNYVCMALKILKLLPYEIQDLVRDYIFREGESRVIKDPENYVISKKYNRKRSNNNCSNCNKFK